MRNHLGVAEHCTADRVHELTLGRPPMLRRLAKTALRDCEVEGSSFDRFMCRDQMEDASAGLRERRRRVDQMVVAIHYYGDAGPRRGTCDLVPEAPDLRIRELEERRDRILVDPKDICDLTLVAA